MIRLLAFISGLTLLAVFGLLAFTILDMRQDARDRAVQLEAIEDRNEERAEENRQLLERLTAVVESMERSAREHRCQSELALLQQTDLIRFGHTHPEQYVDHLESIGCGEFLPVLPGLPAAAGEVEGSAPERQQQPSGRASEQPGREPDSDGSEEPDDDDEPDNDDDDDEDDGPDEDDPLVCVNPPLVPPICVGGG